MSKMTLGYPSRTEAVLAFRAQGLTSAAIAARIGIDVKTVSALEASAKRKGGRREPRWSPTAVSTTKQHTVTIDNDVLIALRPHAARRELSVNQLIRQMIAVIADDGLINALLDDEGQA